MSATRYPPPRQVRGTQLNTISEEEPPETQHPAKVNHAPPKQSLTLQTRNLSSSRSKRLFSPLSAGSASSCSDTEWQHQMKSLDDLDLYDATDEDSEASDDCTSFASTRPNSLITPITRDSMSSSASRNRYPSLSIPSSTTWPSLHGGAPKSSPVPPTPPPKIPVSPMALSMLGRSVPAVHAPPSLDGSVSSDQVSNISAPATPDVQSLPDTDWNAQDLRVRTAAEDESNPGLAGPDAESDTQSIEIAIENPDEDWHRVLGGFPAVPGRARPSSLHLGDSIERQTTPSDHGVFLPEDALAILQQIPLNGTPEPWSETSERDEEMWQIGTPERPRSADDATPASELSAYSFSGLSIPSPGGFFASLNPRARHTWSVPKSHLPPSSATAMKFYDLPFGRDEGEVVEHVVECAEPEEDEQLTARNPPPMAPLTAIRVPPELAAEASESGSPVSPSHDAVREIQRPSVSHSSDEQDENYEGELQKKAMASLDRTSVWLQAQASYLAALCETNPVNTRETEDDQAATSATEDTGQRAPLVSRKKSVRFAETVPEAPSSVPSALASKDSIYWRGFRSIRERSGWRDTFLHRHVRFDAVQSIRIGLTGLHRNCLLGNYELVPSERPPYKGPFSQAPRNSVLSSVLAEKAQFSTLEKEQMVLSQISQPMWAIDALKFLYGGRLIASPAQRYLKPARPMGTPENPGRRRLRALDLGGHASCEWAWQVAYDYPHVQVYTAYTDHQVVNHGIKGPPNHHQVPVSHLWKLPFPDNKFDVISARSLPSFLKTEVPMGETQDEFDLCLKECYRCLKPGGHLEFFVMDAEISRGGAYASATSIEFAFNLKTRGYNPTPTKSFLCRLQKGKFVGVKRAWMFLPMGTEPTKPELPRETPDPRVKSQIDGYEAVHGPIGSTMDVASVSGLFAGWIWEQWLLKLHMEMGREPAKLLEGLGGVFDEGRKNGAGWTCLTGWAMKPKRKKPRGCLKSTR